MTGLTVMQAHLAADCPDRANCWAKDIHDAHDPEADSVTLSRADVKALLGLLLWVHDSVLRQPDNDALIRRVGAAIGRSS